MGPVLDGVVTETAGVPGRAGRPGDDPVEAPAAAAGPPEEQWAAEVLLTFARLARVPRPPADHPALVAALIEGGSLAPRHIGPLTAIALVGPLTVSELAAREGLAVSTTSLLVTQLAEAGLVDRSEDERDRRRTLVSIRPDVRRESEAVVSSRLAPLHAARRRMSGGQASAVLEGLGIIGEELRRARPDAGDPAPARRGAVPAR